MDGPGDIDTMDQAMIEVWNNTVAPDDIVWHLGDVAMGQIDRSLGFVSMLNGHKRLVAGNHDRLHPSYSKDEAKQASWTARYYEAGFEAISLGGMMDIAQQSVLLCHFPYVGDSEGEDRYPEHRPEDRGDVLIHGHIHDMWQVERRMINVGFDAWGRLLHHDEIVGLIQRSLDL